MREEKRFDGSFELQVATALAFHNLCHLYGGRPRRHRFMLSQQTLRTHVKMQGCESETHALGSRDALLDALCTLNAKWALRMPVHAHACSPLSGHERRWRTTKE